MECIVGRYRRSQERKKEGFRSAWTARSPATMLESLMELSFVDCSEVDKGCILCQTDGISDFEEKV